MIVHLEIYVTNQQGQTIEVWRKALIGLDGFPPKEMTYLLQTKEGLKWFFPNAEGVLSKGEHYDVSREVYVSWIQVSQSASFDNFGFRTLIGDTWA